MWPCEYRCLRCLRPQLPCSTRAARVPETRRSSSGRAPITIAGFGVNQGTQVVPSPKVDGYVTGMSADVVDAAGHSIPVSRVMLHHAVFVKVGARDQTCKSFTDYDGNVSPASIERFYEEGEDAPCRVFRPATAIPTTLGAGLHADEPQGCDPDRLRPVHGPLLERRAADAGAPIPPVLLAAPDGDDPGRHGSLRPGDFAPIARA